MASRSARVRLAKLYSELRAGSTAFSGARVDPRGADGCVVEVVRSQVDLQRFSDLPSSNKYLLNGAGDVVMKLNSVPLERGKTVLESTSPSGQWQVRVRAGDKAEDLWLEVWGAQGLVSSLKASDKTSKVYNDDLFGGVSWSMSEGKVCFVGEVAAPKKFKSYFEEEAAAGEGGAAASGSAASEPEVWFDKKYEYKESFGETMDDKVNPAIFVLDVASNKLNRVQLAGEAMYPQQPIFDEKDGLVFAGLLLPVKKLGLNFCLNHKTTLFHVPPSALQPSAASGAVSPARLTPSTDFLAFNARFSQDRSRLVFFRPRGGVPVALWQLRAVLHRLAVQVAAAARGGAQEAVPGAGRALRGPVRVPEQLCLRRLCGRQQLALRASEPAQGALAHLRSRRGQRHGGVA
jgi:hypothetical protein